VRRPAGAAARADRRATADGARSAAACPGGHGSPTGAAHPGHVALTVRTGAGAAAGASHGAALGLGGRGCGAAHHSAPGADLPGGGRDRGTGGAAVRGGADGGIADGAERVGLRDAVPSRSAPGSRLPGDHHVRLTSGDGDRGRAVALNASWLPVHRHRFIVIALARWYRSASSAELAADSPGAYSVTPSRLHGGGFSLPRSAHAACRAAPSATYSPGLGTSTTCPSTSGASCWTALDRA